MLSGEAVNTNFIVCILVFTRSGLEPTIYHTRGEPAHERDKLYLLKDFMLLYL